MLDLRWRRGTFLFLGVIVISLFCSPLAHAQRQTSAPDLDTLLTQKQYPQLEQALATNKANLSPQVLAYFNGVMANRLNQVRESMSLLEAILPNLLAGDPQRGEIALCTVADDYAKSFRYGDASRTYGEANKFAERQGLQSSCHAAREESRWALLSAAPAQTVESSKGEFTIKGKWDAIGLFQIPVTAGTYSGSWIVDTGANLSVISQSVADKLGVETSSTATTAEGSSGVAVTVHTAVIPEIRLGSVAVHNVPVLVAADSSLSFNSINYRIEGTLGLPVLAALGKVTVYRNGEMRFGSATGFAAINRSPHNLFLERFVPLVTANLGRGNQIFTIDTGAVGTLLSAQFYKESNGEFDSGELVSLELLGAGGAVVTPSYQLRETTANIAGKCTTIPKVQLLTEPTSTDDEFYGNIGESALDSFASFTFDFSSMHFSVSGGGSSNCPAAE